MNIVQKIYNLKAGFYTKATSLKPGNLPTSQGFKYSKYTLNI